MEDKESIAQAADILRRGGLLAIPTETVYGLGADGLDETAVLHIFEAKGRPQDNPLILHIPDASWLTRYCEDVPDAAYKLAERFWPGPLTMILKKKPCVPLRTTGGLETVGMRCPDHAVTRTIIEASGVRSPRRARTPRAAQAARRQSTCARTCGARSTVSSTAALSGGRGVDRSSILRSRRRSCCARADCRSRACAMRWAR